jgi:S1-C subfamily serine protease
VPQKVGAAKPPQPIPVRKLPGTSPSAARKSKLPWLIGGGLGALAIVTAGVVAVVALTQSSDDNQVAQGNPGNEGLDRTERGEGKLTEKGAGKKSRTSGKGKDAKRDKKRREKRVALTGDDDGQETARGKKDKDGSGRPGEDAEVDPNRDKKEKDKTLPKKEGKKGKDKPPPRKEDPVVVKDGRLPRAVLDRVKGATVYLRVTLPNGQVAQGSGFFGIEKNIVLTNAHVLGMLEADSRRPQKIEVVLHSGTKRERALLGQVLGVDRSTDLAVLRVSGEDLPAPLKITSAGQLQETDPVFVFGFPFGRELGRNISVRKSSVSSLRNDSFGTLQKVQVEGGIDPGNSGGPVVDVRGHVVGVAVSKIIATQINFAVPGDFVEVILNGRITASGISQPYRKGTEVRVPLTADFLDPLGRVKKVVVYYWVGNPGKPRRASKTKPKPEPGDSAYQKVELDYKNPRAAGSFLLPERAKGKIYWTRVVYVNGAGQTRWTAALPYNPLPPVEHKPALLALKHQPALRPVTLTSLASLKLVDPDGEAHTMNVNMLARFAERTVRVDPGGSAALSLQYRGFRLGILFDRKPPERNAGLQQLVNDMTRMAAVLVVSRKGEIVRDQADASRVPPRSREDVLDMHQQIQKSLQAVSVILPDKEVQAGEKWTALQPLVMFTGSKASLGVMAVTYTYLGRRTRNGRDEALIEINGVVRGRKGRELSVGGKATGFALLDLASGQISGARISVGIDLDLTLGKQSAKANGTLVVRLQRGVVPAKAPSPSR